MKYNYIFKTRDGVRHEGAIEAPSRDEAFAVLRKEGIRPIKVVASDGSRANGEIRGVRKRIVILISLSVAVASGFIFYFLGDSNIRTFEHSNISPRHQVIGDPAIIDKGIRTGWSDVFAEEGERFFASFAIPGVKAGQRNTTVEELKAALKREVRAQDTDGLEAQQIKAMVEGMKEEARRYIAAGGTLVEYGQRLTERQDAEIAIATQVKDELETANKTLSSTDFMALWERRNDELRNLGLRTLPLPE